MLHNYNVLTQQRGADSVAVMTKAPQKLFSMRTDTEEGQAFLAALDRLRLAELPQLDRTAMVKKVVFEADRKATAARKGRR